MARCSTTVRLWRRRDGLPRRQRRPHPTTNTGMTDPENLEMRSPVRLEEFSIRRGSGGDGQWRGGDGAIRRIRFLRRMDAVIVASRRQVAPHGAAWRRGWRTRPRMGRAGRWHSCSAVRPCRAGPRRCPGAAQPGRRRRRLSPARLPLMPNTPTLQEQGVALTIGIIHGIFAPAGTPPAMVAQINAAALAALRSPAMIEVRASRPPCRKATRPRRCPGWWRRGRPPGAASSAWPISGWIEARPLRHCAGRPAAWRGRSRRHRSRHPRSAFAR